MTDQHRAIDRRRVVGRHDIERAGLDWDTPMQLGNGHFAFNADATGLQSFVPFNTLSDWGWHTAPLGTDTPVGDYREEVISLDGRDVPVPLFDTEHPVQSQWLFANPSRANLGRIRMQFSDEAGRSLSFTALHNARQHLDLWSGLLTSEFTIAGETVHVETVVGGSSDTVACRIQSALVQRGQLQVAWDFPYADSRSFAHYVGDWGRISDHTTRYESTGERSAVLHRVMDDLNYRVTVDWAGEAQLTKTPPQFQSLTVLSAEYCSNGAVTDLTEEIRRLSARGTLREVVTGRIGEDRFARSYGDDATLTLEYLLNGEAHRETLDFGTEVRLGVNPGAHEYALLPSERSDLLEFTATFSKERADAMSVAAVNESSASHWARHWDDGGFIDLATRTSDPRALELERRSVQSLYLMGINSAGSLPPQESGLVNNGWHGKFHMEMYAWHVGHWMLWNRPQLAQRSSSIYSQLLPAAREYAARQGFEGARWPKMVGPDGRESPHEIHAYLIWQQPLPFLVAEVEYANNPSREVLERWQEVLESSADFLASYPRRNRESGYLDLGAPLHIVSETTDPRVTSNGAFELAFWRFGLRIADEWRVRLGLPSVDRWRATTEDLAPLPESDEGYRMFSEASPDWSAWAHGHPAAAGAYGLLPGDGVEIRLARRTLDQIMKVWNFQETWGWDFPLLAMSAARLGQPELAIELLLTDNNNFAFDATGCATGGPYPYFPSNGSFLYAMGMLAGGWSGAEPPEGFPAEWNVVHEEMGRAL